MALYRTFSVLVSGLVLAGCIINKTERRFVMEAEADPAPWSVGANYVSHPDTGISVSFYPGQDKDGNQVDGDQFLFGVCVSNPYTSGVNLAFIPDDTELHLLHKIYKARLLSTSRMDDLSPSAEKRFLEEAIKMEKEGKNPSSLNEVSDPNRFAGPTGIPKGFNRCFELKFDVESPSSTETFVLIARVINGKSLSIPPLKFKTVPAEVDDVCMIPFCFVSH